MGLDADGGLVERAERLIVVLLGTFLQGVGVPYALPVLLWGLAAASVFTVFQRLALVHRSAQERAR
jgi:CDP-diacylglycerol--glycerol-3-phosphate 3-phosphatidyltransferase